MTSAAYRLNAESTVRNDFFRAIGEGVRQMRRSTHDLTPKQRWLLDDLMKGKYVNGLYQLCEIGRFNTSDPADAIAVLRHLEGVILAGHGTDFTPREAFALETFANYELDAAQENHAFTPSVASVDRIAEKSAGQEVATSILRHTVIRQRPTLVQVR